MKRNIFLLILVLVIFIHRTGYGQPASPAAPWLSPQARPALAKLTELLEESGNLGLSAGDYDISWMHDIVSSTSLLSSAADTLRAETRITAAAIRYYSHIAYGNRKPELRYDGLNYLPSCDNISASLSQPLTPALLVALQDQLSPPLFEIKILLHKIRQWNSTLSSPAFAEIKVTSGKLSTANTALVNRLIQLGAINWSDSLTDESLTAAVQEAQRQFNLLADGMIRSTFLEQLNVPLHVRLQQLNMSVNYYRWLYCMLRDRSLILINIPSAQMQVYRDGAPILEMKMVLGKKSTPTPTLSSTISDVTLYPYWHVPFSIATKEQLPLIKKNPGYLATQDLQVLNSAGAVVDPSKIDWQSVHANNFPFAFRQATGCSNALGLIKLNFYTPFGVYLHDTPLKSAFLLTKRYFSHGCLRMESPMELGRLLLKDHTELIDSVVKKGCILGQKPLTIPADERMALVVWYNPAGVDKSGRVLFYEDIYKKFKWKQDRAVLKKEIASR